MADRQHYAPGIDNGAQFRRFWSAHMDALERHLDRMDQSTPTKRKTTTRRRGPNRQHYSRSRDHDYS